MLMPQHGGVYLICVDAQDGRACLIYVDGQDGWAVPLHLRDQVQADSGADLRRELWEEVPDHLQAAGI